MTLIEQILLENRIDFLKTAYKDKIKTDHDTTGELKDTDSIVDHFATHADPTKNKQHTQWILNQYNKGNVRQEDSPRIHETLSNFDKYKSKLDEKDINKYPHIADLDTALEPHLGTHASKKEEIKSVKDEGAELIHDTPDVSVHKIKTKEAACLYGAGTKWCTAADSNNQFDRYNKNGPLYVVRDKTENQPEGKKYQFHFESHQFMDDQDKAINLNKFVDKHPSLRTVSDFEGKHEATTSPEKMDEMVKDSTNHTNRQRVIGGHAVSTNNKEHINILGKNKLYMNDVAQNESASPDVLRHIYNTHLSDTEYANKAKNSNLYQNKKIPKDIELDLVKSGEIHPDTVLHGPKKTVGPDVLSHIYDTATVRRHVISALAHKNASKELLDKAAEHETYQGAVASHSNTSPETLERLSKSPHAFIRAAVRGNKNTPKNVLDSMIIDTE